MLIAPFSLLVASPWLVTMQASTSSTACGTRHVLAGLLRQTPHARVQWTDEPGTADAQFEGDRWTVRLKDHSASHPRLAPALREAWPDDLPKLPAKLFPAPLAPLSMACAGETKAAYQAVGAAVPSALAEIAPPPEAKPLPTLLRRWAFARHKWTAGRVAEALPQLRAVVLALDRGERGPTWRARALGSPAVTLVHDRVLLFDDGTFTARDIGTGDLLWRRPTGLAEPHPVILSPDSVLLVLDDAIEAVDVHRGDTIWRHPLREPRAEVAVADGAVFVADAETIAAFDVATGTVRWMYDGLSTPVAGPILLGGPANAKTGEPHAKPGGPRADAKGGERRSVAVPLGGKIAVLQSDDGLEVAMIELDDELSAPLVGTPGGGLWALLGSDEVVHVPAELRKVGERTRGLPGASWPPALLGDTLLLSAGRRPDHSDLLYLDPERGRVRHRIRAVRPPVAAIGHAVIHEARQGRALMARNRRGRPLWTARTSAKIRDWIAGRDSVAMATQRKVQIVNGRTGQVEQTIELDGVIERLAFGPDGGIALLTDGTLYGLAAPDDPRWRIVLQDARIALARAYQKSDRLSAARRVAAKAVLGGDRDDEAQRLTAEIGTALGHPSAVGGWLALLGTPALDATSVRKARQSLARLAGLSHVIDANAAAISATPQWILTQTGDRIEGRAADSLDAVHWQHPGKKLGPIRGQLVRIDERWHRLSDGAPALPLGLEPIDGRAELVRTSTSLHLNSFDGSGEPWSTSVERPLTSVRGLPAGLVLFGGRSAALWSPTGDLRWTRSRPEATIDVWQSGASLLFRSERGLHAVTAATGEQRYRVAVPPHAPVIVDGARVAYADDQTLRFLDVARGRARGTLALSSKILHAWSVGRYVFAALEDGSLVSVDPRRRRRLAAVPVKIRAGAVHGDRLVAIDNRGRLLVFDGKRALGAVQP